MRHLMKRLLVLGAVLAALCCGAAFAAEGDSAIAVQLDGQTLSFTDAAPQVRSQRTFLPFRAVFEAMGVEVSSEGSVITAVRDGRTLTMTLNETTATVTENGVSVPVVMDVAPYVDNETWRTYVPVRFAAQAFDCAVGWDQANQTVILVDTDKLVDQILEGKSFTYLEKLMAYSEQYNEGIWDAKLTMDGSMTILEMPIALTGNVAGVTAGSDKLEMDMNLKMDLTQFIQSVALLSGGTAAQLSPEDQAMLKALAEEGVNVSVRGDMSQGKLYMNMAFPAGLAETAGLDSDAWYSMDMSAMLAQAGLDLDWGELMKLSQDIDYADLTKAFLSELTLTSANSDGYGVSYETFKTSAEDLILALSDAGFQKDGDRYTTLIDGGLQKLELELTMKDDAVVGYSMAMSAAMDAGELGQFVMEMTASQDENGQMKTNMSIDMGALLAMELNMAGAYTQGTTAPVTEPPAGATVIPLESLMGLSE